MNRWTLTLALFAFTGLSAQAHFLFVVPDAGGTEARVFLSEDLHPDADVTAEIVSGATLSLRSADGRETPLKLTPSTDGSMHVAAHAESGTRVIHGVDDLGVKQRGDSKPYQLVYHPKTIVGDAFDPTATLGDALTPLELVPVNAAAGLSFRVLVHGKPTANVEVNVILPNGKHDKATTDANGDTHAFPGTGTFGAWTRHFEPAQGESGGKKFEEVRHYATLVVTLTPPTHYAPMPEAASSFGAVASDGWLYVYGGHTAATHAYSTAAVSGSFHRLNLTDRTTWETLPGGTHLQGMNLATHGGKIYRVGGMEPRNAPGEPADNYSVREATRFDPARHAWEPLPDLPTGRSSHDVAVVGDKLYILGGWEMHGAKAGNAWPDHALVMDLAAPQPAWKQLAQPFSRRALIVATLGKKIYVMGGFDAESEPSNRVDIYDTATDQWSQGPDLPGQSHNGFAPAACVNGSSLFVSVADGTAYRLTGDAWVKVASTTPRIVHRLVPWRGQVLVIGGAANGKNFDIIEAFDVAPDAEGK